MPYFPAFAGFSAKRFWVTPAGCAISLTIASALVSTMAFAQAEDGVSTDVDGESLHIIVIGGAIQQSLTVPDPEEAEAALERVPGGTTLIEAESYRDGPTSNLQDVLEFAPGVYAQNRFGGDEVRLSIRGSGISQAFAVKGLRYLRNGLPVSETDGDFHSQLIEPLTAQYIEVFRGANALAYGASTLGGAINFVTHTGYNADPLALHLEGGSDGFLRAQLSGGDALAGGWDYYASLSGSYLDGFREHAETDSTRLHGNLGYRWNPDNESRLHLDIQDSNQELPGGITLAALKEDPGQSSAFFEGFNSQNDFDRYRFEAQHAIALRGSNELRFGLFYETQDIDHPLPFGIFIEGQDNYGASLRHEIDGSLAGRANRIVWGGLLAFGDIDLEEFNREPDGEPRNLNQTETSDVLTAELFIEDQWRFTQTLTLVVGAQFGFAQRETDFDDAAGNSIADIDEDYRGFSPKLGLIWQLRPSAQLFTNLSRSYEPPIILEFNNAFDPATGTVNPALVLEDQEATTFEVGTRGANNEALQWDLAVYYSRLSDELLTVEVNQPGARFATSNADDTTHAGIELGLGGKLPLNWMTADRLRWRLAATYNRFRFDDDPAFDDNDIPGIPEYFGNLELLYEHPRGFFFGPTLQYASDYFIDFVNSFEADSYLTLGAKAGYADPQGRFRLFVEARNLEDEAFVSNTSTVADAGGMDQTVFNPGQQRAVFAGVELPGF